MKRYYIFMILIFSALIINAMEFDLHFDPCIDFNIGIIDESLSLGISTELPFWSPTRLRVRYFHVTENDNDISSDIVSFDVFYSNKDKETSGYRFFPYIAAGAHLHLPSHDNIDFSTTIGYQAYLGIFYKLAPFNYLFAEAGYIRMEYKPKDLAGNIDNNFLFFFGYRIIF